LIDKVDFFVSFENDILEYEDSLMQIIYGEKQIIRAGYGIEHISIALPKKSQKNYYSQTGESLAVKLENKLLLAPYKINKNSFFTLYNIISKDIVNIPTSPNALSRIHTFLSNFQESIVFEFSTYKANILYYENNNFKLLYSLKEKPVIYYNNTLLKNGFIKEISFDKESQQLCDYFYQNSHKEYFQYTIKKNIIDINTTKNITKTKLCSTIVNSFIKIIQDISDKFDLPIVLCGDLFENKNLSEPIIEYFIDKNKRYYISNKIPLNDSSIPLGSIVESLYT